MSMINEITIIWNSKSISTIGQTPFITTIFKPFFSIKNLTIVADLTAPHSRIIQFVGDTSNHEFLDVAFLGSGAKSPHGIYIDNKAKCSKVNFANAIFSRLRFGIFTSNNFEGLAEKWVIKDCQFINNEADDLEFNSLDNPTTTWSDIRIEGSKFSSSRKERSSDYGFAIGCDSVENMRVKNCGFDNYPREAIHVEDFCRNIIISECIFNFCYVGVIVHQNRTSDVIIRGNIFNGKMSGKLVSSKIDLLSIGVHIANPGVNSSCTAIHVSDNNINGFDLGIVSPVDRGGLVCSNIIRSCRVGIYFPDVSWGQVRNNTLYQCEAGYSGFSVGGLADTLEDCNSVLIKKSKEIQFMAGFCFKKQVISSFFSGINCFILDFGLPITEFRFIYKINTNNIVSGKVVDFMQSSKKEDYFFTDGKNFFFTGQSVKNGAQGIFVFYGY